MAILEEAIKDKENEEKKDGRKKEPIPKVNYFSLVKIIKKLLHVCNAIWTEIRLPLLGHYMNTTRVLIVTICF